MLDASEKAAVGFDSFIHVRCTSDVMPAVHAHARRKGLTSASWLRMVIIEALERGGAYQPAEREAA